MMEDIEFQEIGKNSPYKVPDGFFDRITEQTLREAKRRQQIQKKNLTIWITMAAAASLAAVVLTGYFLFEKEIPEHQLAVQPNKAHSEKVIEPLMERPQAPTVAIVKKDTGIHPPSETISTETMKDVLADLSDDELLQLAAMYKADPFIEEAIQ